MFIIYISKLSDITMKAIKWAGAGASLLDHVSAHLITPRYEDGCCVPVLLRAGVAACRWHASSNDRNGV